ncbi:MAG: S-layer homology domain-containing protein [Armatimonadetes bacterium]|nr:S-layer homology domain-containing protein [Armatimonadota bacterium]
MRRQKKKIFLCALISMWALLVGCLFPIPPVFAAGGIGTLSIEGYHDADGKEPVMDGELAPGKKFWVFVNASDVSELIGFDFTLRFSDILQVNKAILGEIKDLPIGPIIGDGFVQVAAANTQAVTGEKVNLLKVELELKEPGLLTVFFDRSGAAGHPFQFMDSTGTPFVPGEVKELSLTINSEPPSGGGGGGGGGSTPPSGGGGGGGSTPPSGGGGSTPPSSGGGGGGAGGGGGTPPSGGGAPPQTPPGSPPEPVEPRVKWSTTVVDSFRESMVSAGDGLLTAVFPRGALPAGTHLSAAAVEQAEPLRELAFSFGRGFLAAFQLKARDAQGSTLSAVGQPFTLNFTLARADVFRQSPAGGLVRSSAAGLLKESPVGCYYYDPVYGALVPVPTVIRPAAGEITARGGRLGTYVLVEEKPKTFTDLKGDEWYAAAVARLAQKNLFGGFPDGGFHPEENLTRAQAAKLVCLGGRVPGVRQADPFSDTQGHWAALSIGSAAAAGLISGYPDGTFRPDAPVTRAELVVLFLRLLGERAEEGQPLFSDVKPTHWAYGAITRAAAAGLISGYPDGTFRPDAPVTRAEAAGMAVKIINL